MQSGIIRVPLAPIRAAADDCSEMVTQGLFGELLEWTPVPDNPGWAAVKLAADGYTGYTDVKLIASTSEALEAYAGPQHTLTAPLTTLEWEGRPYHLPAGAAVPAGLFPGLPPRPTHPAPGFPWRGSIPRTDDPALAARSCKNQLHIAKSQSTIPWLVILLHSPELIKRSTMLETATIGGAPAKRFSI